MSPNDKRHTDPEFNCSTNCVPVNKNATTMKILIGLVIVLLGSVLGSGTVMWSKTDEISRSVNTGMNEVKVLMSAQAVKVETQNVRMTYIERDVQEIKEAVKEK